jgi:hypothetical protein
VFSAHGPPPQGGGLEATRIRTKVQATTTQRHEHKEGRGGSKKEKKLENYFSKKPRGAAERGERCLNTGTTGRHQQRWRGPETRSHRTAVVGKRACTLHKDR